MNKQTAKACLPKNKRNMPAHNQGKILKIAIMEQLCSYFQPKSHLWSKVLRIWFQSAGQLVGVTQNTEARPPPFSTMSTSKWFPILNAQRLESEGGSIQSTTLVPVTWRVRKTVARVTPVDRSSVPKMVDQLLGESPHLVINVHKRNGSKVFISSYCRAPFLIWSKSLTKLWNRKKNYVALYTRVENYLEWIHETVNVSAGERYQKIQEVSDELGVSRWHARKHLAQKMHDNADLFTVE